MFKVLVLICVFTVGDGFVVYVFRSLEMDGFRAQAVGMFQRVKF